MLKYVIFFISLFIYTEQIFAIHTRSGLIPLGETNPPLNILYGYVDCNSNKLTNGYFEGVHIGDGYYLTNLNIVATEPKWSAESNLYATLNYLTNNFYYNDNRSNYVTKIITNGYATIDWVTNQNYLTNTPTEKDPIFTNWLATNTLSLRVNALETQTNYWNDKADFNWVVNNFYPSSNPNNFTNASVTNGNAARIVVLENRTNIWNDVTNKVDKTITNGFASTNWVLSLQRVTNVVWNTSTTNNAYVIDNIIYVTFNTNYMNNATNISMDTITYIPRSTAPANPVNGMTYYNSTDNKLKVYANGTWRNLN